MATTPQQRPNDRLELQHIDEIKLHSAKIIIKTAPEEPNWITIPIRRKIDHTEQSI